MFWKRNGKNIISNNSFIFYFSIKITVNKNFNYEITSRINNFQIVVDEFQSIFSDASFKASTELSFVDYLQNVPNVCYLSATPVLDKYLEQLDEFKNLPYYELVWDKSMITKPVINRKKVKIDKKIQHIYNYKQFRQKPSKLFVAICKLLK